MKNRLEGGREARWEAVASIQVTGDSGLDWDCIVSHGSAWEVALTRLADAVARGAKGKEDSRHRLVL